MYRQTLNDNKEIDYISTVRCLQSRPAFKQRAISAIQLCFDDFQAVHIQLADRVHLTVSAYMFHDVNGSQDYSSHPYSIQLLVLEEMVFLAPTSCQKTWTVLPSSSIPRLSLAASRMARLLPKLFD